MDRISLLSDFLLIDIISRLPDTKQAIRTSTLSKRWKHLWPQVSNLVFMKLHPRSSCISKEAVNELFVSVERMLDQRQLNLNKFQLHAPYYSWFGSKINKWIRCAVKCNVQELDLSLEPTERKFEFHEFFFINSCFTQLTLKGCILDPCGTVCWNQLKSLSISSAQFDEDVIQNILSGSPVLETLKFESCYGYRRIAITSKSLKNFVIVGFSDLRKKNFEINAPYLMSLSISQARIDEDVIHNILSRSPVLETLKFESCNGYKRIAITSNSVKNFVIAGYRDFGEKNLYRERNLEINAPYIVSLTITDDLCLRKLLLVDVSSVVKAHLDYRKVGYGYNDRKDRQVEEEMLEGFMLKLGNVEEFAIGIHCARVISRLQAKGLRIPSSIKYV